MLIITTANLYAKDYDCVNTDFDPRKTEYYNVITDLEKNKVIYLWKFPLSPHQRVKANKITEVKNDIIFESVPKFESSSVNIKCKYF